MAVAATGIISTPIDLLRIMLALSATFQTWIGAAQTINGDVSTQLSSLVLADIASDNTNRGIVYWELTNTGSTRKVDLFKDVAKASLVASGTRTGDGSITLTEQNSSGLSGSVTVTYTTDDTDAGNTIDTKLKAGLARTFVDWVQGADEGDHPTRPFATVSDANINRFRDSMGAGNQYSERGTLFLEIEAAVDNAHVSNNDGNDAGFDFRNNLGAIVTDIETTTPAQTRLDINSWSYEMEPVRLKAEEAIADDDVFRVKFRIDWGRA